VVATRVPASAKTSLLRRRRAVTDFQGYLDRNPAVREKFKEAKRRETVHVATRTAWWNLLGAGASLGILVPTGSPAALPSGAIALLQARTQMLNRQAKLQKARGVALAFALKQSKTDASIELPDIARWIDEGLVREGDVPPSHEEKLEKRRRKRE